VLRLFGEDKWDDVEGVEGVREEFDVVREGVEEEDGVRLCDGGFVGRVNVHIV
jgi:hypothetical protein